MTTDKSKIQAIQVAYRAALSATDTFEGAVGRDLAYLAGALATNSMVTLNNKSALLRILRADTSSANNKLIWETIENEGHDG